MNDQELIEILKDKCEELTLKNKIFREQLKEISKAINAILKK